MGQNTGSPQWTTKLRALGENTRPVPVRRPGAIAWLPLAGQRGCGVRMELKSDTRQHKRATEITSFLLYFFSLSLTFARAWKIPVIVRMSRGSFLVTLIQCINGISSEPVVVMRGDRSLAHACRELRIPHSRQHEAAA